MKRLLGVCALVLAIAMSVAACGGGMGVSDGKKAADKARRPAAETYWKLYTSLNGAVDQVDGSGGFPACVNGHKNSVYYKITYTFFTMSDKQTQAQLTAAVMQRLRGIGWKLQPYVEHVYKAAHNGITVRLREIIVDAHKSQADTLYIETSCVDVGKAVNVVSTTLDEYRGKDAESAPIPTAFPSPTS